MRRVRRVRRVRGTGPGPIGILPVAAVLGLLTGCGGGDDEPTPEAPMTMPTTITVTSAAFADGEPIPPRFTCDGEDVSPPLEITGVPTGTAELALVLEDPDAPGGTFVHWVMWGLSPGKPSLAAGEVPAGVVQGDNDFGRRGYGGPCPPAGDPHRYVFTLFALAEPLSLAPGSTAAELRNAIADTAVARGSLTGRYGR